MLLRTSNRVRGWVSVGVGVAALFGAGLMAVVVARGQCDTSAEAVTRSTAMRPTANGGGDKPAMVLYDPMQPVGDPASKVRAAPTVSVSPKILSFEPGKVGLCAHFKSGKVGIKYPMRLIPFDEGTIEFDLWFDRSPDQLKRTCRILVYHAGKKYTMNLMCLFFGGIRNSEGKGWGRVFGVQVGDGLGKRTWILTSSRGWPAGRWRHIALAWKFNAEKRSSLALYIDNKLVGYKGGLTIMQNRRAMRDAQGDPNMGYLWLHPLGNKGNFRIDEFKVYNFQRHFIGPPDPLRDGD